MDGELLHIGGDFAPKLSLVGNGGGQILCNGDPHLFACFHGHGISLDGALRALRSVYDDILDEAGNVSIVPTLCQRLQRFSWPGGEGVGAVVGPGPQIGSLPALRDTDHDGNHFGVCCCIGCYGQQGHQQHNGNKNRDCLFHEFSLLFFVAEPNIASGKISVNGDLRKQFPILYW